MSKDCLRMPDWESTCLDRVALTEEKFILVSK